MGTIIIAGLIIAALGIIGILAIEHGDSINKWVKDKDRSK
jgi:hypothetical protein